MSEECNDYFPDEPWFTATVIDSVDHPVGFMIWTEDITQSKYTIILPDGSKTFAKLFMDLQQRFDNNEYTRYLVNRYNEIQDI